MNKQKLSERDICTKFITPALIAAGWDVQLHIREEVSFTKGRIIVRGKMTTRGEAKRADYVLYRPSGTPLAIIEAKDNNYTVGAGMQQALGYAETLAIPFVFSSNGDAFLFHDRTLSEGEIEKEIPLTHFPSPADLWARHTDANDIPTARLAVVAQPYHDDGTGKPPRYYQTIAINRAVDAVARGQNRLLLVMATGTGKTYVAFQTIWRLWKSGVKKRILFLADRNILVNQSRTNDFKPFGGAMTKITHRKVDKSYEIYLALYQAVSGAEDAADIFKQFSSDFFDLIVVDECHRGSAADDSNWRRILDYFSSATHLGLTATPKETKEVSNITYFGEPIYTYSLKQGIEDGFLAPYKVVRIHLDKDLTGWRPASDQTDKQGVAIPDRIYNQKDFDRELVLTKRTELVAKKNQRIPQAKRRSLRQDHRLLRRYRARRAHAAGPHQRECRPRRPETKLLHQVWCRGPRRPRSSAHEIRDSGLADLESPKVLQLDPFASMGTPVQLVKAFGGPVAYAKAIRELEEILYETA